MPAVDLKQVALTVAGTLIPGGYTDQDVAINVTKPDEGTYTEGAGGHTVYQETSQTAQTVEVIFFETSRAYTLMRDIALAQKANGRIAVPFSYIDTRTGESLIANESYFLATPAQSKGRTAQPRRFLILLVNPLEGIPQNFASAT